LRALRKRKPQETQALALASSQSSLPLLRPSIPIGWSLRFLRFSFTQRKRLRLNGSKPGFMRHSLNWTRKQTGSLASGPGEGLE